MLKANLLHLDETHIDDDFDVSILEIDRFEGHFVNSGNGKGIATFKDSNLEAITSSYKERKLQIVKAKLKELDSINLYRSSNKSIIETWEALEQQIESDRVTIITGDFNICHRKYPNNVLLSALTRYGFKQLQREASHIMGGNIDHVYWRDPRGEWNEPAVERYSPYFTDHDGFLITLTKKVTKNSKLKKRKK